eukprot:m.91103 g.91103  ORF g.91103 m.91103 type:complete len:665 (-) comp14893_c0_seq1:141-2135(-)
MSSNPVVLSTTPFEASETILPGTVPVKLLSHSNSLDFNQGHRPASSNGSEGSQYQLNITTLNSQTASNPDLSKATAVTSVPSTHSASACGSPNMHMPPSSVVWPDASATFDNPPNFFPLRRSVSEGAIWHQQDLQSPRSKRTKARKILRKDVASTEGSPATRRRAVGRRARKDSYYSAPVTPRNSRPVSRCTSPTSYSGDDIPIVSDLVTGLTVPSASHRGRHLDSSQHPINTPDILLNAARLVTLDQQLRAVENARSNDSLPTCLAVVKGDEYCLQASHMADRKVTSNVVGVLAHLESVQVLDDLTTVDSRLATDEELQLVHPAEYVARYGNPQASPDTTTCLGDACDSFISNDWAATALAARQSCAAVVDTCAKVMQGHAKSGLVIAQPCGRLVQPCEAKGFGYFNNIAIAARAAVASGAARRVLVVDLGATPSLALHELFADTSAVMVASLHTNSGVRMMEPLGTGAGAGYDLNVAWPEDVPVGDSDYVAAFRTVVLPVANEYQPDLILLAGSFDSACPVSAIAYAHLTQLLMAVSNGKIVFVLESISNHADVRVAVEGVVCALQGHDLPPLPFMDTRPTNEAVYALEHVISVMRKQWPSLDTTVNYRYLSPLEHVEQARKRHDEELDATVALASLSMVAVQEMPTEEALEDAASFGSMEE